MLITSQSVSHDGTSSSLVHDWVQSGVGILSDLTAAETTLREATVRLTICECFSMGEPNLNRTKHTPWIKTHVLNSSDFLPHAYFLHTIQAFTQEVSLSVTKH